MMMRLVEEIASSGPEGGGQMASAPFAMPVTPPRQGRALVWIRDESATTRRLAWLTLLPEFVATLRNA